MVVFAGNYTSASIGFCFFFVLSTQQSDPWTLYRELRRFGLIPRNRLNIYRTDNANSTERDVLLAGHSRGTAEIISFNVLEITEDVRDNGNRTIFVIIIFIYILYVCVYYCRYTFNAIKYILTSSVSRPRIPVVPSINVYAVYKIHAIECSNVISTYYIK